MLSEAGLESGQRLRRRWQTSHCALSEHCLEFLIWLRALAPPEWDFHVGSRHLGVLFASVSSPQRRRHHHCCHKLWGRCGHLYLRDYQHHHCCQSSLNPAPAGLEWPDPCRCHCRIGPESCCPGPEFCCWLSRQLRTFHLQCRWPQKPPNEPNDGGKSAACFYRIPTQGVGCVVVVQVCAHENHYPRTSGGAGGCCRWLVDQGSLTSPSSHLANSQSQKAASTLVPEAPCCGADWEGVAVVELTVVQVQLPSPQNTNLLSQDHLGCQVVSSSSCSNSWTLCCGCSAGWLWLGVPLIP